MAATPDQVFIALFIGIAVVFALIVVVVVLGARNSRRQRQRRTDAADREGPRQS